MMKLFNVFRLPAISLDNTASSTPTQRRSVHGDARDEEFGYQSTRSISSYYSIFVARMAIMVMLAIIIGMLTILTWHFTRVYTTKSINSLAYGLQYELLQRPILRMWNILNSTVEITLAQVKLSEYVIGRYENPVGQGQEFELHQMMRDITWALFASRKALNAITISYKNGYVQAFHRDHRTNTTYYIYSELMNSSDAQGEAQNEHLPISKDNNASAIWYREPLDPTTGEQKGERRQIPPDDLISIAGLSEVRDGAASWRVSVSKFTGSPLLSAALPVKHPSGGTILAAVGVTTPLKSVGQLMRELVDIHSGYMYLSSREGYLLATSTNTPLLRNTTTGLKLMMANDSEDPMIRLGSEWLQKTYGNQFPISHQVHAENVVLGHQRYYIDSFFLNLKRLPMVGVIIIPRKYIMGKVDQIGFTTLIISISASMCILGIGCVCILILTSGVSKAMKLKAELISQLDARRRAEASSNYKSQFLANMSHELRTPMAAVIGLLDILIYDDCLTNEQFATVTQIRKCSTALLRLLNNILDLSKVESGKLILEEAEFDLGRELEGLVDMFSVQCINENMEIILDLSDDMPKTVRGDSARVVQIFSNLISNSMKFTPEGHIILRGRCGNSKHSAKPDWFSEAKGALNTKSKQHDCSMKNDCERKDKIILQFEVDDTGCGIDPSKWESVFESFEQADTSTTRTHGGTGLGLCIVRNFVNTMDGEIKIVKKDGAGTLMQLYLVLGMPECDTGENYQADISNHNLMVLLALQGNTGRSIMSQWLRESGACTWEASDWNGLTQMFQQIYGTGSARSSTSEPVGLSRMGVVSAHCSTSEPVGLSRVGVVSNEINIQDMIKQTVVIVVDTSILDQSTDIWREQLIFLDKHRGKANFVWVVSQNTSSAIKMELQQRGHQLMVNKPLYKTKMKHILENVIRDSSSENQRYGTRENSTMLDSLHELHEIYPIPFDTVSSDESDVSYTERCDPGSNPFSRENTKEMISVTYRSIDQTPNSRRNFAQGAFLDNIVPNPKILLAREKFRDASRNFNDVNNYGHTSIVSSRRYEHQKEIKQTTTSTMADKIEDQKPRLEIGSFETSNSVYIDMTQFHTGEENMREQEYEHMSTSNEITYTKQNLTNHIFKSAPGILQVKKTENQLSCQRLPALACGSLNLSENQYVECDNTKVDSSVSHKMVPHYRPLEGLNLLLAEDNPILQRVATAMLEKVGATVVAVRDGMEAVDAMRCMFSGIQSEKQTSVQPDDDDKAFRHLQKHPSFDLILMDCQMPKLDGYEATKAIRKLQAGTGLHIPIVAVTAHAMSCDEAKCLDVGMDAYLTKPIDRDLMVSTILSLTKRRHLNHLRCQTENQKSQTCQNG